MPAQLRTGTVTVEEAGNELAKLLNKWLVDCGPSTIFKTCENCRNMSEAGPAHCSKFNATPPVAIIMTGCREHDDKEDIPF